MSESSFTSSPYFYDDRQTVSESGVSKPLCGSKKAKNDGNVDSSGLSSIECDIIEK